MDFSDERTANTAYYTRHTGRLDEYKETISQLFPALPRGYVDAWSISDVDALALGLFLECYPRKVTVLDIGTFVGVSAFYFASQPKVLRVISLDPNPPIAYEINDKWEMLGTHIDADSLGGLRVLEIAQTALAEFGDERDKIELHEGVVGSTQTGVKREPLDGTKKFDVPAVDLSEKTGLVVFVDGLHTREGVQADLKAIFDNYPHAVAVLDDCRHAWGPFVQAGVVSFMENTRDKYHFQFLGDLGPSIATSNLGIVYPDVDSVELQRTLVEFSELFSERLDLLRLLRREEELMSAVSSYRDTANGLGKEKQTLAKHDRELRERNSQLEQRNSQLEQRNSQLEQRNSQSEQRNSQSEQRNSQLEQRNFQLVAHQSSRRYKLADAVAEKVLRVPGAKELARRQPRQ